MSIFKEDKNASTAKIAIWYMACNVFIKGLGIITVPIFTRLLTKEEYGFFANYLSWSSILIILFTFNFATSIVRAKYDFSDRMNEYLSTILITSNIITLLSYVCIEINQEIFINLFSLDIQYIRMMFISLFLEPAFSYLQVKHRIYRKYKFFVFFSLLSALLSTTISVFLVLYMDDRFLGRMFGAIIPGAILNLLLWIKIIKEGAGISWRCLKFACGISIPLIFHTLSCNLLNSSDRIMITNYCGAEETALYSLVYSVSQLAALIWISMNQAWAPWLYDNIHANNRKIIWEKSKFYLGAFSVIIVGVFLLSPEVVLLLGGKEYYVARFVMPPIIMACAVQFVYGMYVNLEIYDKKTISISIGTVLAAIVNIGLNFVFIPIYGYIAAAYTTLCGYMGLFVFHYYIVKRYSSHLFDIYDKRFIFSVLGMLYVLCGSMLILYQFEYIRYILITMYLIVMLIVCYKKRLELSKIIGNKINR